MDPLWAARLLHLLPSLFGLVNDISKIILGDHLQLPLPSSKDPSEGYTPEALVTLISLRLVNRETHFFLEQCGYPKLAMLRVRRVTVSIFDKTKKTKYRWSTVRTWYDMPDVAEHVVSLGRPLLRFKEQAFWSLFPVAKVFEMGTNAIKKGHLFIVRALVAVVPPEQVPSTWFEHAISMDNVEIFKLLLPRMKQPGRQLHDSDLRRIFQSDAVRCLRFVLDEVSKPMQVRKLVLHINALITNAYADATAVLVRALVQDMLETRACPTIKGASRKGKKQQQQQQQQQQEEEQERRGLKRLLEQDEEAEAEDENEEEEDNEGPPLKKPRLLLLEESASIEEEVVISDDDD
jgi:hypothetical protein